MLQLELKLCLLIYNYVLNTTDATLLDGHVQQRRLVVIIIIIVQ